ncbi:MAG: ATP-binding protein, partial [Casimicrobiaceae bacterium]
ELTAQLPAKPVYLNADPVRVDQIIGNLLANARKYSDKGGRIRLAVKRQGGWAVLSVSDTGIGIAREDLVRIFDLFSQVDNSLRSHGGLGIGLTLVKRLVEMHGGTVDVQSGGLGQGSEFTVRLPLAHGAVPARAEAVALPLLKASKPLCILVVDDNADAADSLASLLALAGHETHTAHDGIAAVDAAAALRPDVIVLDLGLPRMNGYDAAREIRRQPSGKAVLLIALTGWGGDDDRKKSRDAGFDAHLVKPLEMAAFAELLGSAEAS